MFYCFEVTFFNLDREGHVKFMIVASDWAEANKVAQSWLKDDERWLRFSGYKLEKVVDIPKEES